MSFDTLSFAYFFIPLVILYYLVPIKYRWWLIVSSSVVFYMWSDALSILIVLLVVLVGYLGALSTEKQKEEKQKRLITSFSVVLIIAVLVFYKYAGFFISSTTKWNTSFFSSLIVPLGISYISFQSVGYLVDVRREKMIAEKQFAHFAGYLLFFPKIIAGPVERAQHFLPQIQKGVQFNYAMVTDGIRQFGWGLFKKLVIANRLGLFVNSVYGDLHNNQGLSLVIAAILFSFELYADFSGYTDMALGIAKVLGYDLSSNFNLPFTAKSMTEFWRRWHISLSTWFNDYFFTPLSIRFRDWGMMGIMVSAIFSFLVLGLWHGANWTYVVFGGIHGLAIAIELFTARSRKQFRKKIPAGINTFFGIGYMFLFFSFSCIFFRSASVNDALYFITHLFSGITHWFSGSAFKLSLQGHQFTISDFVIVYLSLAFMFFVEIKELIFKLNNYPKLLRWAVYYFFLVVLIAYGIPSDTGFIYKQF